MRLRTIATLFIAFFTLLSASVTHAQGIPAEGRDFYLGYLKPSYNRVVPEDTKKFFGIFAFVSAYQDTKVYVSYFDSLSGKESLPTEYFVKALGTVEIPLDTNRMRMTDPGDLFAEYRAVHITSEHPVSVMYYSQGACAGGEYLALSTASLGRNYVVSSYDDNTNIDLSGRAGGAYAALEPSCGYFLVVAVHDNTNVTLVPTTTTQGGKHPGVFGAHGANWSPHPYTINLQRGQCYLVKSNCDYSDISGSTVESDKPVAVISGHENAGMGSIGNSGLEGRDYMVEQMQPSEYQKKDGFVAVPHIDSEPYLSGGSGDPFRVYTFDTIGSNIQMYSESGSVDLSIGKFFYREQYSVSKPVTFSSSLSSFYVYQIDQADHSSKSPYPRPSLMSIVHKKNWRTSYIITAPARGMYWRGSNYLTIIGPRDGALYDSIYISKNGEELVKIRDAGLSVISTYLTLANEPSLRAVIYKINSGNTYYLRSRYPFMTYNKGYSIFSNDSLFRYSGDMCFTSYAAPGGYLASMPKSTSLKFRVDTSCIGYDVKIWDTGKGSMIKAAMLLDDPTMDIVKSDSGDTAYVSKNCSFITASSPYRSREIGYDWSDSVVTLRITKDNAALPAEAYLYVASSSGTKLIHLSNITSVGIGGGEGLATLTSTKYNQPKDTTIVFRNISTAESYVITQTKIDFADPNATIISTSPLLPAILKPGDSLKVTLHVNPKELQTDMNFVSIYSDTCKVGSQAFMYFYKTGLVDASDANFGKVAIGTTDCSKRVFVTNRGEMPFTLQNYTFGFANYFSIADESAKQLPKVVNPGDSLFFNVCYTPTDSIKDSAELMWVTDIPAPYDSVYKRISKLTGVGAATAISWDRDSVHFAVTQSQSQQTRRVYLRNNSNSYPVIPKIFVEGPDAPEFYISKTQIGGTVNLELTPFDSIYVDVTFKADLTRGWKYIRQARLVAQIASDLTIYMDLYGKVDSTQTSVRELPVTDFLITPNPLTGGVVNVSFSSSDEKKLTFAVYDVLGREVAVLPHRVFSAGKNSLPIAIGDVSAGVYILRVSDGVSTKSLSFRVAK